MSAPGPEEAQPQLVLQALPAGRGLAGALAQQSGLWGVVLAGAILCTGLLVADAPLWRGAPHAVAVAGGVISAAMLEADQSCNSKGPLRTAPFPPPAQTATILSLMSDVDAANLIPKSELLANGVIDPAYVHNQRVRVHVAGDAAGHWLPLLVPDGMTVWVGETVQFIGGHASPNLACAYVPNLIVGP